MMASGAQFLVRNVSAYKSYGGMNTSGQKQSW
jgi:hypothetical protein